MLFSMSSLGKAAGKIAHSPIDLISSLFSLARSGSRFTAQNALPLLMLSLVVINRATVMAAKVDPSPSSSRVDPKSILGQNAMNMLCQQHPINTQHGFDTSFNIDFDDRSTGRTEQLSFHVRQYGPAWCVGGQYKSKQEPLIEQIPATTCSPTNAR